MAAVEKVRPNPRPPTEPRRMSPTNTGPVSGPKEQALPVFHLECIPLTLYTT